MLFFFSFFVSAKVSLFGMVRLACPLGLRLAILCCCWSRCWMFSRFCAAVALCAGELCFASNQANTSQPPRPSRSQYYDSVLNEVGLRLWGEHSFELEQFGPSIVALNIGDRIKDTVSSFYSFLEVKLQLTTLLFHMTTSIKWKDNITNQSLKHERKVTQ